MVRQKQSKEKRRVKGISMITSKSEAVEMDCRSLLVCIKLLETLITSFQQRKKQIYTKSESGFNSQKHISE